MPSRPDAVYCLADVLAVGALHELHMHGLTVPDDMAMAAFDGTELSRFMVPTLTLSRGTLLSSVGSLSVL